MTAIVLPDAQAEAIAFFDALVGRRRSVPKVTGAPDIEPLHELLAERLSRSALRFVFEQGYRVRTVLRDGRRARGTLTDPDVNRDFVLRFTEASPGLLHWLVKHLDVLQKGDILRRKQSLALRRLSSGQKTDTGDWIFVAQVALHRSSLQLPADTEERLLAALARLSPLAALVTGRAHIEQVSLLLEPRAVRILECIPHQLRRSFRAGLLAATRPPYDVRLVERWATTLEAYWRALDEGRRLDMAGPCLWAVRDWVEAQPGGAQLRTSIHGAKARLRTERDRVISAFGRVAEIGSAAIRRRADSANTRYGDERYEEMQLFVTMFDVVLDPAAPQVDAFRRGLTGVIG